MRRLLLTILACLFTTSAFATTVQWTLGIDNGGGSGVAATEIYRTTGATCTATTPLTVVPAPATGYTDNSVAAATVYSYALKSVDAAGLKSVFGACVSVTSPSTARTIISTDAFPLADTGDLGAAWSGGFTAKNALQIVSGRVRSTVAGTESVETYTPGTAGNAKVQDCSSGLGGPETFMACTFQQPVVTGNLVACMAIARPSTTDTVVFTDIAGNTYTNRTYTDDPDTPMRTMASYALITTGGFSVVTATWSATIVIRGIVCHELRGIHPTTPDDGFVGNYQAAGTTGTDAITSTPLVTTADGDYLFAASYSVGGNILTAGTGYTLDIYPDTNGPHSEDLIQPTAGSAAGTFQTHCCTAKYTTILQAFKPATTPIPTPNDQWACKVVYPNTLAQSYEGVFTRMSVPATYTGYLFALEPLAEGFTSALIRIGGTTLASNSTYTWQAGDQICGESEGTTHSLYLHRGTANFLVASATDATHASGKTGMLSKVTSGAVSQSESDDFSMGGFAALPTAPPRITSCVATATTVTVGWTGPPTSIHVEYPTGSVVEGLSAFPSGVYSLSATILASLTTSNAAVTFYAIDSVGAENHTLTESCTVTVPAVPDTSAPVVSLAFPLSALPVGTLTSPVTITTNEVAECRADTENVAYASMDLALPRSSLSYSYTLSELTDGSSTTRYAACQDQAGNISSTLTVVTTVSMSTADTTLPTAPTDLACAAFSQSQATCTAGASTDVGGLLNYQLHLSADGGVTYVPSGTFAASPFTPVALPAGTLFYAKAYAVDTSLNLSLASNIVSFTTLAFTDITPPSPMVNLRLTPYKASIFAEWNGGTDTAPGFAAFSVLEAALSPACSAWATTTTTSTVTSLTLGLTLGTAYCVRGRHVDGAGNFGPYSDTKTTTTLTTGLAQPRRRITQPRLPRVPS